MRTSTIATVLFQADDSCSTLHVHARSEHLSGMSNGSTKWVQDTRQLEYPQLCERAGFYLARFQHNLLDVPVFRSPRTFAQTNLVSPTYPITKASHPEGAEGLRRGIHVAGDNPGRFSWALERQIQAPQRLDIYTSGRCNDSAGIRYWKEISVRRRKRWSAYGDSAQRRSPMASSENDRFEPRSTNLPPNSSDIGYKSR
jgi:hypothetical protein